MRKRIGEIEEKVYDINENIVSKRIYGEEERKISNIWIELSKEINFELETFLDNYIEYLKSEWILEPELAWIKVFFRIKAYFDKNILYILSMEWAFVDGLWIALNFMRSIEQIKKQVNNILLLEYFPKNLVYNKNVDNYKPEFELLIKELNLLKLKYDELNDISSSNFTEKASNIITPNDTGNVYVYWETDEVWNNILPYNWKRIDDKKNLAKFSKEKWKGTFVKIPPIYTLDDYEYSRLPKEIVFKIANLDDVEKSWRNKFLIWKPKKEWKWLELWEEWKLVAQEQIEPWRFSNWEYAQIIIATIWNKIPAWWYVQISDEKKMNDGSRQAPLTFWN